MRKVALRESPGIHLKAQSDLTFARGNLFEKSVLANDAARLVRELKRLDIVGETEQVHYTDLRTSFSEDDVKQLDEAVEVTERWLSKIHTLQKGKHLVSGVVLRIPRGVLLPEATLKLDVTYIDNSGQKAQIVVGEIKSYADRGGFTPPSSLASARAQAGVYIHAFQLVVDVLNLNDYCEIKTSGFLVLASPGTNFPSLRWDENLEWQAERARRGFILLEGSAAEMEGRFAFDEDLPAEELLDLVLHAETDYKDACISFCERAPTCHDLSLLRDDGAFLGDDAKRFLNGVKLSRAEAIINGSPPTTDAEADLKRRLEGEVESAAGDDNV
jgi:hypothetical protein